jgi:hypothetical protein
MDPNPQNTQPNEPPQQPGQIFGPSAADVEPQPVAVSEQVNSLEPKPLMGAPISSAPVASESSNDWLAPMTQPSSTATQPPETTPAATPEPDEPQTPSAPSIPVPQPYNPPSSATHQSSILDIKKSKAPLFIVIILVLIIGSVAAAIALHKKTPQKTANTAAKTSDTSKKTPASTSGAKTPDPVTPAPGVTATPQELATEFVRANQGGNKALADNLLSLKFKAALKEVTESESFYDYCKNDQFCDSLKWITLDKVTITVTDDKLDDGTAVKDVLFSISTTTNNAKSTSNLDIYLSASNKSWLVEDVEQSFGLDASQQKTSFRFSSKR